MAKILSFPKRYPIQEEKIVIPYGTKAPMDWLGTWTEQGPYLTDKSIVNKNNKNNSCDDKSNI